MTRTLSSREDGTLEFSWTEVSGAVGDAATVLPVVAAVGVLTDLSLSVMLLWFGVFQIVWGFYYATPMSVEPMKALAALAIGGKLSTGELVVAGLLLAGILLLVGLTRTLATVERYTGTAVVRGIQFAVGLVLLEASVDLVVTDLWIATLALAVAAVPAVVGYRMLSAFAVFLGGAALALAQGGVPELGLPAIGTMVVVPSVELTTGAIEATLGQLSMTLGNAALATALLVGDYFDRDISPDQLSTSMGAMNAIAVPLGGFPMCHGSGGVAGKFAFGARTAGANVVLGVGYVTLALVAVELVASFPTAAFGVILALVALQLGYTALSETDDYVLVVAIGLLGILGNLGIAFVVGAAVSHLRNRL